MSSDNSNLGGIPQGLPPVVGGRSSPPDSKSRSGLAGLDEEIDEVSEVSAHMVRRRRRKPLTKDQLLGIANYLTYGRIAMVPFVVAVMMMINDSSPKLALMKSLSWLAMGLFSVAQFSDIIDGYYARKYGVVSSFGKFIDPLADKLMSMSIMIMLIPMDRMAAWMVALLIAREVSITALRGVAASEGVEIAASDWGKKKTFIQSFAMGALLIHYPFLGVDPHRIGEVLMWMTLAISLGSGLHYILTFFAEVLRKNK
ncbi:MAG: CDP-diacylglycerol--glycerol-3-phosphate 3-phosphatidyltransferase [Deltaproteobacteria bacterium]|nr:MAG: CDP-diacylglycerol--glycerol-3-phosphate 3-phosphatidyltransferase [Deltaproteobacteria bacterium]